MAYEFKKVVCKADDYPGQYQIGPLERGDKFVYVVKPDDPECKPGDPFQLGNHLFFAWQIVYKPRKWWQFWKRKRPMEYIPSYDGEVNHND